MILKRILALEHIILLKLRKKRKLNTLEVSFRNKGFNGNLMVKNFFGQIKGLGRYWQLIACCLLGVRGSDLLGRVKQYDLIDLWFTRFNLYAYLDKVLKDFIIKKQDNGCYQGLRLSQALPVRGQRTRSNSKTVRRLLVRVVIERQGRRRRRHFKNNKLKK